MTRALLALSFALLGGCEAELADASPFPEASDDLALRSEILAGLHRDGDWVLSLLLTDPDGLAVDAPAQSFSAFVDADPVPARAVRLDAGAEGVAVVVVVDEASAGRTLSAVRNLLVRLRPPFEVEVIRVAGEVVVVAPFEHPAPLDVISTPAGGSGRRLHDAMLRAIDDVVRRPAPLRLVWLLAAGADEGSQVNAEAVRVLADDAGVTVVAVGTGSATPGWMRTFAHGHRYAPDALGFGGAAAATSTLLAGIWQVVVTAPRDVVVDVRYLGEGDTRELEFPTMR